MVALVSGYCFHVQILSDETGSVQLIDHGLYLQDDGEVEEVAQETRTFLLEWLKGQLGDVSTQMTVCREELRIRRDRILFA